MALPSPAVFLPCPPQELGVWTDSSMPKASPLFHYQHISFDLIEVIELSLFASSCMSMASLFFIISFCWHSVCLLLSYRSAMPSGLLHWAFAFRSIQLLMHTWSVRFFGPRPLFCQSPRWRYSFGWHLRCIGSCSLGAYLCSFRGSSFWCISVLIVARCSASWLFWCISVLMLLVALLLVHICAHPWPGARPRGSSLVHIVPRGLRCSCSSGSSLVHICAHSCGSSLVHICAHSVALLWCIVLIVARCISVLIRAFGAGSSWPSVHICAHSCGSSLVHICSSFVALLWCISVLIPVALLWCISVLIRGSYLVHICAHSWLLPSDIIPLWRQCLAPPRGRQTRCPQLSRVVV